MATKTMTAEHKAALAQGRVSSRAVRNYLDALSANKPKRGRRRTPDSIRARLATIETELETASNLSRLQLTQERINLTSELTALEADNSLDMDALETDFCQHAKTYGDSKGISYSAWRETGVSAAVLKRAGISR